jgi:hypothetical protein
MSSRERIAFITIGNLCPLFSGTLSPALSHGKMGEGGQKKKGKRILTPSPIPPWERAGERVAAATLE